MTSAVILAVILPFLTGAVCCAKDIKPSRPIELRGVWCDGFIVYPVSTQVLNDEEVRI